MSSEYFILALFICFASSTILNKTAQSVSNPAYISNFSLVYFNDAKGDELMNMSFSILKDVNKAVAMIAIKTQTNKKRNDYDREIFKGQIDVCKASQGVVGNFITKFVSDNLENHSNYRFVCPTKAGFYYFTNFPTMSGNALPSFVPRELFRNAMFFLKIQGKVADNKPAALLLSISIAGAVKAD